MTWIPWNSLHCLTPSNVQKYHITLLKYILSVSVGVGAYIGVCIYLAYKQTCKNVITRAHTHRYVYIDTYTYLGTPKGHNFSLKRKNRLLGSQAEILAWGWFQAIFWYSGWFCLNLNLNLERNKAESRKEVKNYLVILMLTVSFSCPVELGQTII